MATQVQYRRGTQAQNDAFTGALGEMTIDTTNGTMRVHNGVTAGGSNIATVAYVTSALSTLDATKIYSGNSNVSIGSSNGPVNFYVNANAIMRVSASGLENSQGNGTGNIGNASAYFNNLFANGSIYCTGIVNAGPNAAGNIGSSSKYFNTVFATATTALYADLAEMYSADAEYAPGTVLDFGGEQEVTVTTVSHTTAVAGIVSTNPSYLMNAAQPGDKVVAVALTGRVPCQVVGTIKKGDRLVASDIAGVATVLDMSKYQPGCIIGKALEAYDSQEVGTIEVAVGRD